MRQLVLDIRPEADVSFDNFVVGDNAELIARLDALAEPDACETLYVWGVPGSGRSHLLRATAQLAQEHGRVVYFVRGQDAGENLDPPSGGLLVVDDLEDLSEDAQIALFRAFNNARLTGLSMLLSGGTPPLGLHLREDLRTRVGQSLTYQVRSLSDNDKADTFLRAASARGMKIEREIVDYLLRHSARDLPSLLKMLDEIDRVSLEQKRPITLPLVRELVNAQAELEGVL
ncbi:MAG: hypothetical protein RIR70_317 [Pseudomonadota bacterium]|jgi:DnaA family protein